MYLPFDDTKLAYTISLITTYYEVISNTVLFLFALHLALLPQNILQIHLFMHSKHTKLVAN